MTSRIMARSGLENLAAQLQLQLSLWLAMSLQHGTGCSTMALALLQGAVSIWVPTVLSRRQVQKGSRFLFPLRAEGMQFICHEEWWGGIPALL